MTQDLQTSLHLGLSAEAMLLIDPQLEDSSMPSWSMRSWLLRMMFCLLLLLLLPGAPFISKIFFGQFAKAAQCASRCNAPSVTLVPRLTVFL